IEPPFSSIYRSALARVRFRSLWCDYRRQIISQAAYSLRVHCRNDDVNTPMIHSNDNETLVFSDHLLRSTPIDVSVGHLILGQQYIILNRFIRPNSEKEAEHFTRIWKLELAGIAASTKGPLWCNLQIFCHLFSFVARKQVASNNLF